MPDHTVPDPSTEDEEARDAEVRSGPDRPPTPDEEAAADRHPLDPAVAEAEKDFNRLGAEVKGEGQLP